MAKPMEEGRGKSWPKPIQAGLAATGRKPLILAHWAPHRSARQVFDLSQQSQCWDIFLAGVLSQCSIAMPDDMAGPTIAAATGAIASEKPINRAKMKRIGRTAGQIS